MLGRVWVPVSSDAIVKRDVVIKISELALSG